MTNEERDDLLIRLDMRTAASERWETKHEELHKEEKTTRTRWTIFLAGCLVSFASALKFWK